MKDSIPALLICSISAIIYLHFTMKDSIPTAKNILELLETVFTFHYERFDTRRYSKVEIALPEFTFHYERFDTASVIST